MTRMTLPARRRFLLGAASAGSLCAFPMVARAITLGTGAQRDLSMDHTHTHEHIALTYAVGARYLPNALDGLNRFLRDHYSGTVGHMDPALYDIMHALRSSLKVRSPYEIISGFRSPHTNERLRARGGGGVATRSLHMEGVPLAELRDAALELKAGGVGYYPGSDFVHVDTGRVRAWSG
jgi:uncharacterized protein YcbK (DUF882 family)